MYAVHCIFPHAKIRKLVKRETNSCSMKQQPQQQQKQQQQQQQQ